MAIMYPTMTDFDFELAHKRKEYQPSSKEKEVYERLSRLDDDYHVFYSHRILGISSKGYACNSNTANDRECDFVIYHRQKGILCLEVKASVFKSEGEGSKQWEQLNHSEDTWHKVDNPYHQVQLYCAVLYNGYIKPLMNQGQKCPVGYAVWFLDMHEGDIPANLPNAVPAYSLYKEDYLNTDENKKKSRKALADAIDGIFERAVREPYGNARIDSCHSAVLDRLRGAFNIVGAKISEYEHGAQEEKFMQLFDDQSRVLDFLRYERKAAIWGIGGSGKTLLAVEKARRLEQLDDGKVLFMCFNTRLKADLKNRLEDARGVDVLQFAELGERFGCVTLSQLPEALLETYLVDDTFPYKHMVIDEFQDLGADKYNAIISTLIDIINERGGSTFVFYDDRQIAYRNQLPDALEKFKCRLALYAMCRNTEQIASCALAGIGTQDVDFRCSTKGKKPILMRASEDAAGRSGKAREAILTQAIGQLKTRGCSAQDIQIVTCLGRDEFEQRHQLDKDSETIQVGKNKIRWATVREFKGLEAVAVILTDVTKDIWIGDTVDEEGNAADCELAKNGMAPGTLFYIGASRAKHELCIVCEASDVDCEAIVDCIKEMNSKKRVAKIANETAKCTTKNKKKSPLEQLANVLLCDLYRK